MTQRLNRRSLLATSAATTTLSLAGARPARSQGAAPIRIGVLTALSGPYTVVTGPGCVLGARMAVEDFTQQYKPDFPIEILQGDIMDRVDNGLSVARSWFDRDGVDAIADVANSALTLALVPMIQERDKVGLFCSSPLTVLTGANCSPNHVQWVLDTYAVAKTTGAELVKQGGDTWFFIVADYAFGHSITADTVRFVEAAGGRVAGKVAFPFPNTTDFSAFLLQAEASGAKVVALAAAGTNAINLIKQASEFGLVQRGQQLASLILVGTDIHSLGLEAAQKLVFSSSFDWNLNDDTRSFGHRFATRLGGAMPTMYQAGAYSSVLHYLKSVAAIGPERAHASGRAVVEQMKAMPTDDVVFGRGSVRADGRKIHDFYLFRVKTPTESKGPWDYCERLETLPGREAFRPLTDGSCPLVKT
ncbi:MAG: ABC transporter substrate-binding protein [Janthinobacterium lividum]